MRAPIKLQAIPLFIISALLAIPAYANPATKAEILSEIHSSLVAGQPVWLQDLDTDDDGDPDIRYASVQIVTPNDLLIIYDEADIMPPVKDLENFVCYAGCVWVLDVYADQIPDLAIRFIRKENEILQAQVYDDINNNGKIDIVEGESGIKFEDGASPAVIFEVKGNWFLPSGDMNWNIRVLFDGPQVEQVYTYGFSDTWKAYLKYDGQPDTTLEFFDLEADGIPENGIWRLSVDVPDVAMPIGKTWIWSNEGQKKPVLQSEAFIWPYLVSKGDVSGTYFQSTPYLTIDWEEKKIERFSFDGYPIEEGYHVNTLTAFIEDELNYANFENTQAYYDLAHDIDGYPELHIRHRYFGSNDRLAWNLPTAINEIRWSWNQNNIDGLSWDYKLGLAGRHEITQSMSVAGFNYYSIPYRNLPAWVTKTSWDIVTFVARENTNYVSTEGVYAWGAIETMIDDDPSLLSRYLAGEIELDPGKLYTEIPLGFRGEYNPYLGGTPLMYFSFVDHKLHLQSSQHGIWQINSNEKLVYQNLNGDHFLDEYTYLIQDQIARQMLISKYGLIVTDEQGVWLKDPSGREMVQESIRPPTDYDEWEELAEILTEPEFEPTDFANMLQLFPGSLDFIPSARAYNFQLTDSEVRFVLEISPESRVNGKDSLELARQEPGIYMVKLRNGQVDIEPLELPRVRIALSLTNQATSLPSLAIQVVNTGNADLMALQSTLMESCAGVDKILHSTEFNLLAGQQHHTSFFWDRETKETCSLSETVWDTQGMLLAREQVLAPGTNRLQEQTIETLRSSTGDGQRLTAYLLLVALAVSSGVYTYALFQRRAA